MGLVSKVQRSHCAVRSNVETGVDAEVLARQRSGSKDLYRSRTPDFDDLVFDLAAARSCPFVPPIG